MEGPWVWIGSIIVFNNYSPIGELVNQICVDYGKDGMFANSPERWQGFITMARGILARAGEPNPGDDRLDWFVPNLAKITHQLMEKSTAMSSAQNPYEVGDSLVTAAMAEWEALPAEQRTAETVLEMLQKRL